jgi:hypothetical protein
MSVKQSRDSNDRLVHVIGGIVSCDVIIILYFSFHNKAKNLLKARLVHFINSDNVVH